MTMQSLDLLPSLRELPGGETNQTRSFREIVTDLVNTDRTTFAGRTRVGCVIWHVACLW